MRKVLVVALVAAGFAVAAIPRVSAAPSYGAAAINATTGVDMTQEARWYGHRRAGRRHHCWWRHGRRVCGW